MSLIDVLVHTYMSLIVLVVELDKLELYVTYTCYVHTFVRVLQEGSIDIIQSCFFSHIMINKWYLASSPGYS